MKTYWNASVSVDGVCKVFGGAQSLAQAITDAVSNAIYYQAQYPESKVTYDLEEHCAVCHNEGQVRASRFKMKRCPECKGKLAQGAIVGVKFEMPDPANNIKLLAG